MDIADAVLLGLVQGLTEFIPVSSSGHLILASELFGLSSSFEFDVLLNIGTILALVYYFRKRIAELLRSVFSREKNVAQSLAVAVVPALIIGGLFTDSFDSGWIRSSQTVAFMLINIGILMLVIDRKAKGSKTLENTSLSDGLAIGTAQLLALIPGTSRSGITILSGRLRGFSYASAAEFSFLLGLPILSGAVARVLLEEDARQFVADNIGLFLIGNLVSFLSGLLAVSFMIGFLQKNGLSRFGYYRIALGLIVLLVTL